MNANPLKVTFAVAGGWVPPSYPLHLDSLLAYVEFRRSFFELEDSPTPETIARVIERLPCERHTQDGEWVWKASALMPVGPTMSDASFYTQRRDKVDYSLRVRDGELQHGRIEPGKPLAFGAYPIDTLRGVHRNLLGYFPVQRPIADDGLLRLVAWCIGDRDQIEEALTDGTITHLGARRRSGFGRIVSVTVEEDPQAHENWALRVRPWKIREDDAPIQATWKPPYTNLAAQGAAFMPMSI